MKNLFCSMVLALLTLALISPDSALAQEAKKTKAVKTKRAGKKSKRSGKRSLKRSAKRSSKRKGRKVIPKKVDVKNLGSKYWESKKGKFKVVQNRTYTKTKKLHLSVMPSFMLNEEYGTGSGFMGGLGYYFTDRWGLELEYQSVSIKDNELQNQVIELGGFVNSSIVEGYYGITGKFMPLYAKMSWLGSKIVYFDLSFGLSVGNITYQPRQIIENAIAVAKSKTGQVLTQNLGEAKSSLAYGFEVSQSFYLSKKFLIRVDYKHRFFNEEVFEGAKNDTRGAKVTDRGQDSISLNLGLTYIF